MGQDDNGVCDEQHGRDNDGLRHVDACHLRLAVRQVDGGDYRCAYAEHQGHARVDEKEWGGDVDRRQRIAADAFAHEDAVGDDEDGREYHAQDGRYQQLPE